MTSQLELEFTRQEAEDRLAAVTAQAEIAIIERAIEQNGNLRESYGWQRVDDYPDHDWHHDQFGGHAGRGRRPLIRTSITDHQEGRCRPFYETESDLAFIRANAQNLAAIEAVSIGAVESLLNYTVGTGFTFEVAAEDGFSKGVAKNAQRMLDETFEANEFKGGLDQEIHNRSVVDGESFVRLDWDRRDGEEVVNLDCLSPDSITEPARPELLDEALGTLDKFESCWTFGVHREKRKTHPLGYYAVWDDAGTEWDYIPAARVEHFKRNVPRSAKRGVSHFYSVGQDIEREAKLKRNIAEGASVQAAIAFIREHAEGTPKSAIESLVAGNRTSSYERGTEGGTKTRFRERFSPGTIKDVGAGLKYHAGPMGQSSAPTYIDVAQFMLRSIGIRWNMPEYMISSDASNANFASTLVSESPFVKARENDQEFFVRRMTSLAWKILGMFSEAGRLPPIDELRKSINVTVAAPEVASRDKQATATTNQILQAAGVLSRKTWAAESGLDYEEEQANRKTEPTPAGEPDQLSSLPVGAGSGSLGEIADAVESLLEHMSGDHDQDKHGQRGGGGESSETIGPQQIEQGDHVESRRDGVLLVDSIEHNEEFGQYYGWGTDEDGEEFKFVFDDGDDIERFANYPGSETSDDGDVREPANLDFGDDFTFSNGRGDDEVSEMMGNMLGSEDRYEAAKTVGAPSGSDVEFDSGSDWLEISYSNDEYGISATRTIRRDGEDLVMTNDSFFIEKKHQRKGIGTQVLDVQTRRLQNAGFDRIETTAARGKGINGYSTWPKLGYDAVLDFANVPILPSSLSGAERVSDLMKTKDGRDWWVENGVSTEMTFDLSDNSRSMEFLDDYIANR